MKDCRCRQPPFHYLDFETNNLGMDSDYADVSIDTCKLCNAYWLKYLIEEECYSQSGRWWRVELNSTQLDKEDARAFIEKQKNGKPARQHDPSVLDL